MAPLIVITGTGTDVGKTHVACGVLRAWGARATVVGFKPVETGTCAGPSDRQRLAEASTFHVKPETQVFRTPVSPHLASRLEGKPIDVELALREVNRLRKAAGGVVVELAGGLFTPFSDVALNSDIVRLLHPSATILVAPDRLGVLHDIGAATRAADRESVILAGIILNAPATPDASTGTNATEASRVTRRPLLITLPRTSTDGLAKLLSAVLDTVLV